MSPRPAHHSSGTSLDRSLWRGLRRLCATPATDLDAECWADWLMNTRVLEDGINPSFGHPRRTVRNPHTSTYDTPGATA